MVAVSSYIYICSCIVLKGALVGQLVLGDCAVYLFV